MFKKFKMGGNLFEKRFQSNTLQKLGLSFFLCSKTGTWVPITATSPSVGGSTGMFRYEGLFMSQIWTHTLFATIKKWTYKWNEGWSHGCCMKKETACPLSKTLVPKPVKFQSRKIQEGYICDLLRKNIHNSANNIHTQWSANDKNSRLNYLLHDSSSCLCVSYCCIATKLSSNSDLKFQICLCICKHTCYYIHS